MSPRRLLAIAVLLTACASDPEVVNVAGSGAGEATPTTSATTTTPPALEKGDEPQKPLPPKTTTTTRAPKNASLLDPASAVLGGVIIGGGGDASGYEYSSPGYQGLEAQTDCEPFNTFETRIEFDGATRSQSLSGVSVLHVVYDVGAAAETLRDSAGRVAVECEKMIWLEGGTALNDALPLELPDGWVGFRQRDVGSDVDVWTVAASRDNLLSVVTVVAASEIIDVDMDAYVGIIALADAALWAATPAPLDRPTPTSPTTTTSIYEPTTTTSPWTTTTTPPPVDPGPLEQYLLDEADLGRPVFIDEDSISPEEFEACAHASAFAAFFGQLQISAASFSSEPDEWTAVVVQMIGPVDSPGETQVAMRELEELTTCALDAETDGEADFRRIDPLPDHVLDAAVITLDDPLGERFDIVFVQLDDVVMYLGLGENSGFTPEAMVELIASKAG